VLFRSLVVADSSPASDLFRREAAKKGIDIDSIPMNDLSPIIEPFMKEFADRYKES
jgi:hypothetical protein